MSILWLVARSGLSGGCSALAGWTASELLGWASPSIGGPFGEAVVCAFVGAALGSGLSLIEDGRRSGWGGRVRRIFFGAAWGAITGAIAASLGHAGAGVLRRGREFSWGLMGAGIGAVEGLHERSTAKLRQGVVAATLGGLAGGLPFVPLYVHFSGQWESGSRALAFAILGTGIGVALGISRAVLVVAWLTVVEGEGLGRRCLLAASTFPGEGLPLPFTSLGRVESERPSARIVREPYGGFALEALHGALLNRRRVVGRQPLHDGDLIRIGATAIRYNTRWRSRRAAGSAGSPVSPSRHEVSPPPSPRPLSDSAGGLPEASATKPSPAPAPAWRASEIRAPRMSLCPKCQRPVPGTRPYCVVCKISF